jgi:hypothetical protein
VAAVTDESYFVQLDSLLVVLTVERWEKQLVQVKDVTTVVS